MENEGVVKNEDVVDTIGVLLKQSKDVDCPDEMRLKLREVASYLIDCI